MRILGAAVAASLCVAALSACTTNKSIAPITTLPATLEMSVGTVNDGAGTLTGTKATYLNVVSSFRNAVGNSAYQSPGTATLTAPGGSTLYGCGLFSYGQDPGTIVADNGLPHGTYPNANTGLMFGVPPAYNPPDQNFIGYALGFWYFFQSDCATFQIPPAPAGGAYNLQTGVAVNGATVNYTATASLPAAPLVLPNMPVPTFVSDGKGGGTFTITLVSPATEYLIVINNGPLTEVAAVETTTTTATIVGTGSGCLGGGTGVPIPCGTNSAFVIGADYPLVEAGPPANTSVAPTLIGAQGTSDLTISKAKSITE